MSLHVLSAGAAKGLVGDLAERFRAATGEAIDGVFSAVGAIRERFEGGAPCDVVILTAKQLAELEALGRVRAGTVVPIGTVQTAVAVPLGQPLPDIATGEAFAAAIGAASAIYMPDPFRSTAGIHLRNVFEKLGLANAVASRLRVFPNGETAMRALSTDAPAGGIGLTQATEILYTVGLVLVDPLPPDFGLATVYAAGVSGTAASTNAGALVSMLTGVDSASLRRRSGFG